MADLVDWRRAARTLGAVAIAWAAFAILASGVTWLLFGTGHAAIWSGLATLGAVATAIAVLAGTALRGMLRAGERGERLAGDDVGLLPPRRRS